MSRITVEQQIQALESMKLNCSPYKVLFQPKLLLYGFNVCSLPIKFHIQSIEEKRMMKVMNRPPTLHGLYCRREWGGHSENVIKVVFLFPESTCCRSLWTKLPSVALRLKSVVNGGSWGSHWGHSRSRPWCGAGWGVGVGLTTGRVCWKRCCWNQCLEDNAQKGAPAEGAVGRNPNISA